MYVERMVFMRAGTRIDAEDDLVVVILGKNEIYKGLEDYDPFKNENWKWVTTTKDGRGHYELYNSYYGTYKKYKIH